MIWVSHQTANNVSTLVFADGDRIVELAKSSGSDEPGGKVGVREGFDSGRRNVP